MARALCGSDQLLDWDRPTKHLCKQVLNIPEPGIGVAWPGGLAFEALHNFAVEAAPVCLSALLQAAQQVFWNVVERNGGHGTNCQQRDPYILAGMCEVGTHAASRGPQASPLELPKPTHSNLHESRDFGWWAWNALSRRNPSTAKTNGGNRW